VLHDRQKAVLVGPSCSGQVTVLQVRFQFNDLLRGVSQLNKLFVDVMNALIVSGLWMLLM
jgi:ABC-type taurine transport system ATPase subunit